MAGMWQLYRTVCTTRSTSYVSYPQQDALPTAALPLETALPVVDRPEDDSAFPGLYASAFAGSTFIDQPFIGASAHCLPTVVVLIVAFPPNSIYDKHPHQHPDDDHFMTSTQWRNSTAIIVVHLPTGRVVRATPPQSRSDHVDSWSLLSLQHGERPSGVGLGGVWDPIHMFCCLALQSQRPHRGPPACPTLFLKPTCCQKSRCVCVHTHRCLHSCMLPPHCRSQALHWPSAATPVVLVSSTQPASQRTQCPLISGTGLRCPWTCIHPSPSA